jgi:2-polyprenyl-6-methoxyphenol hydroxylase-like FAD-dependent oxidoreductase
VGYSRPMRAVVVGGGIGGLSSAIALERQGVEAVVLESAPDIATSSTGTGLHIWPNAMVPLQQAGIADEIVAGAAQITRGQFQSWRGPMLTDFPVMELTEETGVPAVGIDRHELHGVLAEALKDTSIRTDSRVTAVDQDADGVSARLADGSEVTGDVLVAADGARSTIRSQLHGEQTRDYAGYAIWRTIVDYDHEDIPVGLFRVIWGRGCRFVFFHVRPGRLYWSSVSVAPEGGGDPDAGRKAGVAERHRGWPAPIERVIDATPEESIGRMDTYEYKPLDSWTDRRVTLLGDSAHPMTFNLGQGACQAIEDAFALAEELAKDGDAAAALGRYEDRRREYTSKLMKQSRQIGSVAKWQNPLAVRFREQLQRRVIAKQLGDAARSVPQPST